MNAGPALAPSSSDDRRRGLWRAACAVAGGLALGYWIAGCGEVFLRPDLASAYLFDDALFFARYADVFLATGHFAFNPADPATFGNSSQLFQLAVTFVYWLSGREAALSVLILSMAGQAAALLAIVAAYRSLSRSPSGAIRAAIVAAIVVHVCLSANFLRIGASGMETGWAAAAIALAVRAIVLMARDPRARSPVGVGIWAPLAYAIRPDLAPLIVAPLALMSLLGETAQRRAARSALAVAVLGLAGLLAGLWLYYGDAVPLAMFVKLKGLSIIGDADPEAGWGTPYLYSFVRAWGSLFVLGPVTLIGLRRRREQEAVAVWALWLAGLGFVLVHWLLIVPIMGFWGRFYFPALMALALPGLLAAEMILARVLATPKGGAAIAGLSLLGLVFAVPAIARVWRIVDPVIDDRVYARAATPTQFTTASLARRFIDVNHWLPLEMLDVIEAMAQCSIADSEDGWLSVLLPRHYIVDLSGLHDRRMAHEGFSAARLLGEQRPDILIYPHVHYRQWNGEIDAYMATRPDYIALGPMRGYIARMAVRRDSPCAQPLQAIHARYAP